jgi:hypothetical protein
MNQFRTHRSGAGGIEEPSRSALAQMPHAAAWASRFASGARPSAASTKRFRRQDAPSIVRNAVQGIAQACVPDPDELLRDLLVQAIGDCAAWARRDPNRRAFDTALWVTACRRIGGHQLWGTPGALTGGVHGSTTDSLGE